MDSSDRRSSLERFISNGLFLGIEGQAASDASLTDYVTESTLKYVTVFSNRSTKYNQMVKRFPALLAIVIAIGAGAAACHKSNPEEAIRQGVIDYLSKRS